MADETTRFKKFLSDQEEAVQLARATPEGSDPMRIEAINVALSLAHSNAIACDKETMITQLLRDAQEARKFLAGQD